MTLHLRSLDVIPLRIPFHDGSAGVGLMPQKWTHLDIALVRIEDGDGIVGWGDGFAYSCLAPTVSAIRDMVRPHVLDREIDATPNGLMALNLELQKKLHLHGRYGITMFAISAVDIALWDLAAKRAGLSLADFIGGRKRNSLTAYASLVRYGAPAQVASYCAKARADGYSEIKLHEVTLDAISAARDEVGGDVRLTTDVNCNWTLDVARSLLPEMKALDLYWVEEPVFPPDDADTLAALEAEFGVAIASGENACTSVEFARTVPKITFAQPSVTKVGGVSEFLRICDLAKAHGKTLMPHAPYFGPGFWATAQLMAAREECGWFEHFYITPEAYLDASIPLPRGGKITVPQGPGLGFEPDGAVVDKYQVA